MIRGLLSTLVCLVLVALPLSSFAAGDHDRSGPEASVTAAMTDPVIISGKLKKMESVMDSNWFNCSSGDPNYVDVPGMEITFKTKKPGPVLIMFEGEFWGTDCMLLRALHNGLPVPGPGEPGKTLHVDGQFSSTDVYSTHGFNFTTVATAGLNNIRIQCATHSDYDSRYIYNKSLIVLHK